jgi:hypothetical protein
MPIAQIKDRWDALWTSGVRILALLVAIGCRQHVNVRPQGQSLNEFMQSQRELGRDSSFAEPALAALRAALPFLIAEPYPVDTVKVIVQSSLLRVTSHRDFERLLDRPVQLVASDNQPLQLGGSRKRPVIAIGAEEGIQADTVRTWVTKSCGPVCGSRAKVTLVRTRTGYKILDVRAPGIY